MRTSTSEQHRGTILKIKNNKNKQKKKRYGENKANISEQTHSETKLEKSTTKANQIENTYEQNN